MVSSCFHGSGSFNGGPSCGGRGGRTCYASARRPDPPRLLVRGWGVAVGYASAFNGAAERVLGFVGGVGVSRAVGGSGWCERPAPVGSFRRGRSLLARRSRHDRQVIGYPRTCTGPYRDTDYGMGKQVSVYVRDEDLPLWERAEEHARRRRMPVSGLVMTALEEYLARHEPGSDARIGE